MLEERKAEGRKMLDDNCNITHNKEPINIVQV